VQPYFEEEYDITLREFAPTAVKVKVESNGGAVVEYSLKAPRHTLW
jgi:hypothetical protein